MMAVASLGLTATVITSTIEWRKQQSVQPTRKNQEG